MHFVLPLPPGAARWYVSSTVKSMGVSCPPLKYDATGEQYTKNV
jgi:hypothetical protein